MTLVDLFWQQAQQNSQRLALRILSEDRTSVVDYSWRELGQLVNHFRSGLLQEVERRERFATGAHQSATPVATPVAIATWLPNGLAWIIADLAIQSMGWVHVALDRRLPEPIVLQLYRHSGAVLLLSTHCSASGQLERERIDPEALLNRAAAATASRATAKATQEVCAIDPLTPIHPSSPAQVLYTSGTLSQPRGVLLSHANLLSNAQAKLTAAPQSMDDIRLNLLPLAHAYARTCELSTWILSGSVLCLAGSWSDLLYWAPVIKPTLVNLVPHLASKLAGMLGNSASHGAALLGDRLRLLQVGGAALPRPVWDRLAQAGWPPLQGYGLTETSPVVCSNRAGQQQPDSVGYPVPGVELRLDERGVLWTRGPHVMLRYLNDAAATQNRIVDGWLCTGDLAHIHADGRVTILGRIDDQLTLSTGYKVSPFELTQRLAHDAWVESVVIVGQGRPYLGALVYPRRENIPSAFARNDQQVVEQLVLRFQDRLGDLPRWMQIERIALLPEPLSVENGGLNFKGAIRRKHVEEQLHPQLVQQIYAALE